MGNTYIALDLKSFYASVECAERGLDPLTTNLVVADASRTEKTICLAVSPPLKAYGIKGRPRLFEVIQKVKELNAERREKAFRKTFAGKSFDDTLLRKDRNLELDYITATPRMALYIRYSARIYGIYLKYVASSDIHVYSIDEVFMDVTRYLKNYGMTARQLAVTMIQDVLSETGITATAGIGSNLYLCKIAMDIVAKHSPPDKNGVRIAELDEMSYRKLLWGHRPLTDFWRVGTGMEKKLEANGLFTMGDIAACSLGRPDECHNAELLYRLFGVNAELLIDHAWGIEPCTMAEVKAYRPASKSISSGQVLKEPYTFEKARLVLAEMLDSVALDLTDKGMLTDQLTLTVGYDVENLRDPAIRGRYGGKIKLDGYEREIPAHAHGTVNLKRFTSSPKIIAEAGLGLYERITENYLLIRRLTVSVNRLESEESAAEKAAEEAKQGTQLNFFAGSDGNVVDGRKEREELARENNMQKALLDIKKKFGKNAVLKGMDFAEGATMIERNCQIGGHRA